MLNIDENTIKELLAKEIKDQVGKYIKSKTFEQMVKQEIVNCICSYKNIEPMVEFLLVNNPCIRDTVTNQIANKVYDGIITSLTDKHEPYDDESDW